MLTNVTKQSDCEICFFFNTLYICKIYEILKEQKLMSVRPTDNIDKKLAQMYATKVTVNLEAKSTLSPNEFWNSMELIALNNKAVMNFRRK